MFDTQIIQLTESILCLRRPSYVTCSYMVNTSQGVVLVDAGMDSSGRDVRHGLRHIGQSVASIRAILLTHWHNDHSAGASEIYRESRAPVYYHAADEPFLTRRTAKLGLQGWLSDLFPEFGIFVLFKGLLGNAPPRAIKAANFVSDGQEILSHFLVIETPGHTAGHVSYYYEPEKALFAGDALAVVGSRVRFMARPVTMDLEQARASMLKCLTLDVELLCPGHRIPLTKDVKPRLDEMKRYLAEERPWPFFG